MKRSFIYFVLVFVFPSIVLDLLSVAIPLAGIFIEIISMNEWRIRPITTRFFSVDMLLLSLKMF